MDRAILIIDCDAQMLELCDDSGRKALPTCGDDPAKAELIGKILLLRSENQKLMERSRGELAQLYLGMLRLAEIQYIRKGNEVTL